MDEILFPSHDPAEPVDAGHWQKRAEETMARAVRATEPALKRRLEKIAREYARLAEIAQRHRRRSA